MTPKDGDTIVVWFSCGAASAVATWLTLRCYGHRCDVRVVNNYIKQEDADNRRFLADVEQWLGVSIEQAKSSKYPAGDCVEVWDDRKYISGTKGAPCTTWLKKKARDEWEGRNLPDQHWTIGSGCWLVMGFTADEEARHNKFVKTERPNLLSILIEAGLTKQDCFQLVTNRGIELPLMYRLGYPNANCIGCVKATSPTYWNHVRKVHPQEFAERAEQSRRIGCKLTRHQGKRLFLDELPADAVGRPMKSLKMPECTIFCEEEL